MKMPIAIFPAMAAIGALLGADVPQKSQADYYFSRPAATNSVARTNLVGKVVGQPPAYRVLRREDVAWLREAACERAALAGGSWWGQEGWSPMPVFGHFPLSQSNRFLSVATAREWRGGSLETNIVVGWMAATNAAGVWLPGTGWTAAADEARPDGDGVDAFRGLTFGSGTARYLAGTNGLIAGAQHVVGNLPAHTSVVATVSTSWQIRRTNIVETLSMPMTNGTTSVRTNGWSAALPSVATNVATNVTAGTAVDLLFAGREAPWDDVPAPAAMRPFPSYSYVTNSYEFLRAKKWLAEETANTNVLPSIARRWQYDYGSGAWQMRSDTRTNYTAAVGYFADGIVVDVIAEGREAGGGRLVFPTRWAWDVVHTGGVCRIKAATLYADVQVWADWWPGGEHTNAWGRFVKRIGAAAKVATPQGGKVCFEATVDGPAVAREGAAAIGAPVPASWATWGDGQAAYAVSFILVCELQPWTSLEGWQQQ